MGILSGIRVLDLATYIAGPAAATILSDFGAEVIKVERPPHGDPYRYLHLVPGMPVSDQAYCWTLDSRNKKSLALDLGQEASRPVVERLVTWCDVLITNFQPFQLSRFRLRYEDLAQLNSRMVYASVTGYGESGEEADKPGFDATAYWARSGLMATMHNAGADPAMSPAGFGDHPTSMTLFAAIILALYQRERTGRGSHVSTSLLASGAWSNSCNIQAALSGAQWPVRRTRITPANPMVNHYVTRDGQRILFCMLEPDRDWLRLTNAFEWPPELKSDERFQSPVARRENATALVELIDAAMAGRDLDEWARIFARHEVVWGLVPLSEQVARDPQMHAEQVIVSIEGTAQQTVMSPITIEGVEKQRPRLAPEVGEHSAEILELLGFGEAEIRHLGACGAFYAKKAG